MSHPAATPGRGYGAAAPNGHLADDDSGDISLARTDSERPLAASSSSTPRKNGITAPIPQRAGPSYSSSNAGRWPGNVGVMRSSSARPERVPEGDVGERPRSASNWRPPSPSPSPSPTRTPMPTASRQSSYNSTSSGRTVRQQDQEGLSPLTPVSPHSPLSPLHNRRIARSRSLNVRIPSVDMSARSGAQSATSATQELQVPLPQPAPSPRPPPLIDDETAQKMARWVKEIVVCNFDLERGPVVERRAGGRRWGPGVKENV